MASQTQILPLPVQQPFRLVSALWRDAALAAHLTGMALGALAIGFGHLSLEMARWGMNVVFDSARSFAD